MTPDVVIVDLDGTLLDTRQRHHGVYCEVVSELGGTPQALGPYWAAKRRREPLRRVLAPAFDVVDPAMEAAFAEKFIATIENDRWLRLDQPLPGARSALARLRRMGLTPVLLTARRNPGALTLQLDALGVIADFAAVFVSPGPGAKHVVLDEGTRRRALWWIGDTEQDATSARELGVGVSLVASGIRNRRFLAALNPDSVQPTVGSAVRALANRRGDLPSVRP